MIPEWVGGITMVIMGVGGPVTLGVILARWIAGASSRRVPSDAQVAAWEHEVLAPRSFEAWGHDLATCAPCRLLEMQERNVIANAHHAWKRRAADIAWVAETSGMNWQLESGTQHSTPIPEREPRRAHFDLIEVCDPDTQEKLGTVIRNNRTGECRGLNPGGIVR